MKNRGAQVNKPARAYEGATAAKSAEQFERFLQAHPKAKNRNRSFELWLAVEECGVSARLIIWAAQRYRDRTRSKSTQYLIPSDIWLERRGWEDEAKPGDDAMKLAAFWAEKAKAGGYIPQSAVSPDLVECMLANQMASADDLRKVGVRV